MKLKHLFLALALLLAASGLWFARAAWRAHKQLVTLDEPNATLAVVLPKIERQVWQKIRAEESLAGVHVTIHVKDAPLPEVLDRLAFQAGARWNTLYAIYRDHRALNALDSALQADGKLASVGWAQIAPAATPSEGQGSKQSNLDVAHLPGGDSAMQMAGDSPQMQPDFRMDTWAAEALLLESSLTNRLSSDLVPANAAPFSATAAQTARKVGGGWTTYYALHKLSMGVGSDSPRGTVFQMGRNPGPAKTGTGGDVKFVHGPESGHLPDAPIPNRRFSDFTPEQRVQFARQGHGPGG